MDMADRIQQLRKSRGISQEELADRMGVSRQAVSKWESRQSSPDIEKIILLSDYFETTTDFLLRGIAPEPEPAKRWNAKVFAVMGTVTNAVGLVLAVTVWIERQMAYAVGIGLIIMLLGTGIFLTGQCLDGGGKPEARRLFLLPNVWILLLIPLSCCFNILDGRLGGYWGQLAPIPLLGNSIRNFLCCWAAYFAICIAADIVIAGKSGIRK